MAGGAAAAEALAPGMHVRCEMQGLGAVEFTTIQSGDDACH